MVWKFLKSFRSTEMTAAGSPQDLGRRGEEAAAAYLKRQGFRVLERCFRTRYGEIDIVAQEGTALVFVEVKSRSDSSFAPAELAVGPKKREKMTRGALWYVKRKGLRPSSIRFDVVAVYPGEPPTLIRNAFEPSRYSY